MPVFRLEPELKPSKTSTQVRRKPILASGSSQHIDTLIPLVTGMIYAVTRAAHECPPQSSRRGSIATISTYRSIGRARATIAIDRQTPAQYDTCRRPLLIRLGPKDANACVRAVAKGIRSLVAHRHVHCVVRLTSGRLSHATAVATASRLVAPTNGMADDGSRRLATGLVVPERMGWL